MGTSAFKKRLRDIRGLPMTNDKNKFLMAMSDQLCKMYLRYCGCGSNKECKKKHIELKLEYYWNEYGIKETA